MTIEVAPGALMSPVIERVVAAVGARAGLGIDQLADARLAAEAVAAAAVRAGRGSVVLRATAGHDGLALVFGPFAPGESRSIRGAEESPSLERVLVGLADDVAILADGDGECLRLTFRPAG